MSEFLKRTWAEIDLNAIEGNYKQVRSLLAPNVKMMCVVKADAYGHGVEFVANTHQRLGAEWFGVSNIEEALQLRRCGIIKPILILGYTPPERADELYKLALTQAVFSLEYAQELSEAAIKYRVNVNIHLKVDTGMGRIGFVSGGLQSLDEAEKAYLMQGLSCEGIFTHFAVADDGYAGRDYTLRQFADFKAFIAALEARGLSFKLRHCCNSAATIAYSEMHLDMVRPGIILYGLAPSEKLLKAIPFLPAMQLRTVISMLKTIPAGSSVSYGRLFVAERQTVTATVPIGYADGYPRPLSGKMDMLVNGIAAPIIGRICMDQTILDVTDVPEVKSGMQVTVFGTDKGVTLPVDRLAACTGTINYEMVCLIGKRVPRIFYKDGNEVGQVNYILDTKV
ncbi:MAG: alanine racemase [Oscillospiraceae bacterium]|nr:alanine racemase [Oscillospiraceae bacterium]